MSLPLFWDNWTGSPPSKKMQNILQQSRQILADHNIDYLKGMENLHWAENAGHSIKNARKVLEALQDASPRGKKEVIKTLKELADKWPNL